MLKQNWYKTFEKKKGNMIKKSKVGYVGLGTIKEAITRTAYMRKQNPIWILKNTGLLNMLFFAINLFDLIKDYYNSKKRDTIMNA